MSNTGDVEMALIKPTTSNQSQNQDASQDGVENGKGHEISKGNWGLFNSSQNEWKKSSLGSKVVESKILLS